LLRPHREKGKPRNCQIQKNRTVAGQQIEVWFKYAGHKKPLRVQLEQGEEGRLKALAEAKSEIEKRMADLRKELEFLSLLASTLDQELAAKSFKTAAAKAPRGPARTLPPPPQPVLMPPKASKVKQIKSREGEILAKTETGLDVFRIIPSPEVELTYEMKPFSSFLVGRVLAAMESKDKEMVASGQLQPGMAFSFEIKSEEDRVQEIEVRNYRTEGRLREVLNATRWTLETILAAKKRAEKDEG